jgi:acyl-CoA reductase-like NAD-dependent aldehyde dehydrogenase
MIAVIDHEQLLAAAAEEVREAIATARRAQFSWAKISLAQRARWIGELRPLLAQQATEIASAAGSVADRPVAEKLVSEVLPLLESCRFLEKNAARILRSRRYGARGRPAWLHGSSFEVFRKPLGVVLIVGPGNYPLFMPVVQMLHALVAGNAVVIKPAEGASLPVAEFVQRVLSHSAIPKELVHILPEDPQAARAAVQLGVDKAVFTGSSCNGRDFLAELAKQNTPSVMELSGADTVFVRADADVQLAAKAIQFGSRLNNGDTCMAPHAIVAHASVAPALERALRDLGLATEPILPVRNDAEALEIAAFDEHGLGAAIFSRDEAAARNLARQLATGFATINDIIVPTADPRFPFGGVRGSGFGVTRGAEGLLEMTHPQSIAIRRTRFLPHLEKPQRNDGELFAAFALLIHGRGVACKLGAIKRLIGAGRERIRASKEKV